MRVELVRFFKISRAHWIRECYDVYSWSYSPMIRLLVCCGCLLSTWSCISSTIAASADDFQLSSTRSSARGPHNHPTSGRYLASRHLHLRSRRDCLMQVHLRASSGEDTWLKIFHYIDSPKLTTMKRTTSWLEQSVWQFKAAVKVKNLRVRRKNNVANNTCDVDADCSSMS